MRLMVGASERYRHPAGEQRQGAMISASIARCTRSCGLGAERTVSMEIARRPPGRAEVGGHGGTIVGFPPSPSARSNRRSRATPSTGRRCRSTATSTRSPAAAAGHQGRQRRRRSNRRRWDRRRAGVDVKWNAPSAARSPPNRVRYCIGQRGAGRRALGEGGERRAVGGGALARCVEGEMQDAAGRLDRRERTGMHLAAQHRGAPGMRRRPPRHRRRRSSRTRVFCDTRPGG